MQRTSPARSNSSDHRCPAVSKWQAATRARVGTRCRRHQHRIKSLFHIITQHLHTPSARPPSPPPHLWRDILSGPTRAPSPSSTPTWGPAATGPATTLPPARPLPAGWATVSLLLAALAVALPPSARRAVLETLRGVAGTGGYCSNLQLRSIACTSNCVYIIRG